VLSLFTTPLAYGNVERATNLAFCRFSCEPSFACSGSID
jgi:hypothetical protein